MNKDAEHLVKYLEEEKDRRSRFLIASEATAVFIAKNKKYFLGGISPSQWSAIRDIASSAVSKKALIERLADEKRQVSSSMG